jgi:hypothetical protein
MRVDWGKHRASIDELDRRRPCHHGAGRQCIELQHADTLAPAAADRPRCRLRRIHDLIDQAVVLIQSATRFDNTVASIDSVRGNEQQALDPVGRPVASTPPPAHRVGVEQGASGPSRAIAAWPLEARRARLGIKHRPIHVNPRRMVPSIKPEH